MNPLLQPVGILAVSTADLLFVGLTLAFFLGAIAFAWFCQKVR